MKVNLLFALLLLPFLAFSQGIIFEESKSWDALLAEAKQENKLIFLDAYTTWCGPCKKLSKEVFPMASVGSYFNDQFVNVKMDMEKGEGIALANKFEVIAYPTLLFVDATGTVQHRFTGYAEAEELIEIGKTAQDPKLRLSSLEARFADGDRSPEFLRGYTQVRFDLYDGSHQEVAELLFKDFTDPLAKENLEFVYRYTATANSPMFDHMMNNQAAYEERFGKKGMRKKIEELIPTLLEDTNNPNALAEIEALLKQLSPNGYQRQLQQYQIDYYTNTGNVDQLIATGKTFFKDKKNNDWNDLNNVAWSIYESENASSSAVKQAIKWAKNSTKISKNSNNLDTLAHLYSKAGKTKKAIKVAKSAIAIGRSNEVDVANTQALLQQLMQN